MRYRFPDINLINLTFRELNGVDTLRSHAVAVLVNNIIENYYRSPFVSTAYDTGEALIIPPSIKYGMAVRYAEIGINPEMEPNPNRDFSVLSYPFLNFMRNFGDPRVDWGRYYGGEWPLGILPTCMKLGYGEIDMVRQEPVPPSLYPSND